LHEAEANSKVVAKHHALAEPIRRHAIIQVPPASVEIFDRNQGTLQGRFEKVTVLFGRRVSRERCCAH
jgi:hypothetical protein